MTKLDDTWIDELLVGYAGKPEFENAQQRQRFEEVKQAIQKQLKQAELRGKLKMINNMDSFMRGGRTTFVDHLNFLSTYRAELEAEMENLS